MKISLPSNFKSVGGQVLVLVVAALILFLLARMLGDVNLEEVIEAIRRLSDTKFAIALSLTGLAYAWLIGFDYLALRFLKKRVPLPQLIFTSLTGFAVQRNIGPAPITGGAVRYRYYRRYGFSAADCAVIATLCGLFFAMGIITAGGLALSIQPHVMAQVVNVPASLVRLVGIGILVALIGYLYWSHSRNHPIRVRNWQAPPPSIKLASVQLLFGLVDLCLVAAVAWILLPQSMEVGYLAFLGMYVVAVLAGVVSHVPGGLGVFESVLLLLLPGGTTGAVLGSLLAFRGIYYLLPLLVMAVVAGLYEVGKRLLRLRRRVSA